MCIFTSKIMLGTNYFQSAERDFFLQGIGYNDFHGVMPIKIPRVQGIYTLHFVLSGSGTLQVYGKQFREQTGMTPSEYRNQR